ncbi:hypothetical protein [Pseudobacteriovorax antillogorgiicola]|uniref:Uncharacterized protein n=1 Tax=Pseudobacteriovorax antillogorgiicola TaxID=1513793 RepID=A0A1Y6C9R8_9BACT|nr:hypothetical protein [Pseudobacteriovorax antillogorgiicola]TCS49843.1 hypothetical protein EDD56_11488 [Pseudobacteriovorax antillogorgiicola]SMF43604.1 hypothetical protein SAMN06296036_11387 [Pseudobacteriovorax antillogorgiicola]
MSQENKSLLQIQRQALGYDVANADDLDVRREQERMNTLSLPPLELPTNTRQPSKGSGNQSRWYRSGILALVAMALLTVFVGNFQSGHEGLRIKGKAQATIFVQTEKGLDVKDDHRPIEEGQAFRIQVSAPAPFEAWYGVYNQRGEALDTREQILQSYLVSSHDSKKFFVGGLALTEENEGEELRVVVCPEGSIDSDRVVDTLNQGEVEPGMCHFQVLPLR